MVVISSMLIINFAYAGEMGKINASTEWTGFYGGINLGYTTPNSKKLNINAYNIQAFPTNGGLQAAAASVASGSGSFSLKNDGFIGGGQIGYARNFYNSLVAGLEADIQGIASGNQKKSFNQTAQLSGFHQTIPSTLTVSKGINYLGTLRGRLGYLITPTFLFSGTGGLVYAGVSSRANIDQSLVPASPTLTRSWSSTSNYPNTRVGWTAGGNFEWMIRSNWSAKIEYLYYDLGTVTYNDGELVDIALAGGIAPAGTAFFTNGVNTTTSFDGHIVRIGVNYHFA